MKQYTVIAGRITGTDLVAGPFQSRREAEQAATAAISTGHRRGSTVESYLSVTIVEDDDDDDDDD